MESIVAAAAARMGHTVLHIDTAGYYGGDFASFTLEGEELLVKLLRKNLFICSKFPIYWGKVWFFKEKGLGG